MAEPEEGTGQAGPPSGCSSSFIRAFGPIDRDRPGPPEAVPIEMLVVDLLQDLSVLDPEATGAGRLGRRLPLGRLFHA